MSCNGECFSGALMADYRPQGNIETIHGRETYVARPPNGSNPKGIVIIIPDAFGLPFPNNKNLADRYAKDGNFLVYLPDFMDGRSAPVWMLNVFPQVMSTATIWDWIVKPYYIAQAMYASGQYTSAKSGKVLCDAHFTAHASNVKVPDDAKKVTLPLSVAQATEDMVMTLEQARQVEAILREKAEKQGLKHSEVVYYEGANHGFGVRADQVWGNEKTKEHADGSIKQAIDFYNRVFQDWTAQ
ncbi:hypothetical protein LTR64_007554 [Lithohypha guttulata]|uniref:Dienelactone hydrolase domain-containing protein n=1 Tax=Lithohypha guttulata TaxID=1690604 RepID=A0AAN7SYA3_9EURO|nr:hypothetical protein LTR51_007064 [Lithohypha guttulata]KAK5084251.1 hypothetical protein LTR05_005327 [Lithohypha guttulata]